MGERAKKKRAAEATAARKAKKAVEKATQPVDSEGLASTDPTGTSSDVKLSTQSNAKKSKKICAADRLPSSSSTRRSTRSVSASSGTFGEKHTSAGCNNESMATRPQRSASAAAKALLPQLQYSDDEPRLIVPTGIRLFSISTTTYDADVHTRVTDLDISTTQIPRSDVPESGSSGT